MKRPILPLETARLRLEAYGPGDAERLHRVLADPEAVRSEGEPATPERSAAWLAAAAIGYDELGIGRAAVVLRETGETIGDAGIRRAAADGENAYELGVIIVTRHQGRGYATEITRALLVAAFGVLGLGEVRTHVPLEHVAARRVAERTGFRFVRAFARPGGQGPHEALYAAHAPARHGVPRIKMCGMTSPYDAELAVAAGADAVGMIFAPSERRVDLEEAREIVRALPPFVERVAVFVDASGDEVRRTCDTLGATPQFSGRESDDFAERFGGDRYLRVRRVAHESGAVTPSALAATDPRELPFFETSVPGRAGGTGRSFDWSLVAGLAQRRRVGIGGGLTPENVGECVRIARPYAVDVRSGVESGGKKSFERMQAFVAAATSARAGASL